MIVQKYLIITSRGNISIREREPRLGANEIALRVALEVPDAIFRRPILRADLKVPREAVPGVAITPEIATNVEQLIKQATGLEMVVSIVAPEDKSDTPTS